MAMMAAFDAIPNIGTDIRHFRRKERYDLYGRSHMRSNTDEYDADSGDKDEEYEGDEMNTPHHGRGHKKWWISLGVAIGLLIIWLGIVPPIQLSSYPQANSATIAEQLIIQKTHKVGNEYDVTAIIPGFKNQTSLSHTIHGDIVVVKVNIIHFLGSSKGYQLSEVTGQNKSTQGVASFADPDNSIQLSENADGYLTTVENNPWLVPTVAVSPCTVQLGPINDFNSHSYNILVSPDGTCYANKLS